MDRLFYYSTVFAISLIAFILFHFNRIIDTFVFIAFALSSFLLVYSREELPKDHSSLQIPEVHFYQKSRMNIYGYSMATMLVILSISFSFLSVFLNLRLGITSLLLWLVAIITTRLIIKYTVQHTNRNTVIDYVTMKVKEIEPNMIYEIQLLTKFLISQNVKQDNLEIHRNSIKKFVENIKITPQLAERILNEYLFYTSSTLGKLTSSEIKAINEIRRD